MRFAFFVMIKQELRHIYDVVMSTIPEIQITYFISIFTFNLVLEEDLERVNSVVAEFL